MVVVKNVPEFDIEVVLYQLRKGDAEHSYTAYPSHRDWGITYYYIVRD